MAEIDNESELYPCVGVCMFDPDGGYCLGCGRPPAMVETKPNEEADAESDAPNKTPQD